MSKTIMRGILTQNQWFLNHNFIAQVTISALNLSFEPNIGSTVAQNFHPRDGAAQHSPSCPSWRSERERSKGAVGRRFFLYKMRTLFSLPLSVDYRVESATHTRLPVATATLYQLATTEFPGHRCSTRISQVSTF